MWSRIKSIVKFLYHRVVLISLAILIQLIALVSVVLKFNDYFVFFYWACLIISMIAVFLILNGKSNPSYKIAWIIPILLFPIFGGLFYIFFGGKKLSRRERRKLKSIGMKVENALVLQPEVLSEIMLHDDGAAVQSRYIQNVAHYPPHKNSTAEYLSIGEKKV